MSKSLVIYAIAAAFFIIALCGERIMYARQKRRNERVRRRSLSARMAEMTRREAEEDYRRALSQEDWDYKYLRRRSEDN